MKAPNIAAKHGFTTRQGGVSKGIFKSLNLRAGYDDPMENVAKNYEILCNAVGLDHEGLVFSKQVHKDRIRICSERDKSSAQVKTPYEADGLITDIPGLPLMIFTADCTPILLWDKTGRAVGAVHAGWRGTVADIAGKAVRRMSQCFGCRPENIKAAIGPCISKCCFETGAEVYNALSELLGSEASEFGQYKGGGKYMIDLKGANRRLLENAGVTDVAVSDECTMCSCDKYWSHRATDGKRGVQCSFIALD